MSNLLGLKDNIIKQSQEYYSATSSEDREKHKKSLRESFKEFHKFRHSQKNDYIFVEKIIKNII